MNCPTHPENRLKKTKVWKSPDGLDPKMTRHCCNDCIEYWYKIPRHCVMRWEEIEQLTLEAREGELERD